MKKLFIEVADNHAKRELGLMNRKNLAHNAGMLFKFPYTTRLSFWMKDTYIPLDIAFLDDSGKILQIEEMVPLSTRAVSSNLSCRYALEVNKGWFKANGIKPGHRILGEGITERRGHKRTAQMTPLAPIVDPNVPPVDPNVDPNASPASNVNADVLLNMSYKQRLEDADVKGKDLIVIYRTKGGIELPPKTISPPFKFEKDEDGHHDAIVKVWDNQEAGWKSLIIDNIISMQEKDELIEGKQSQQ